VELTGEVCKPCYLRKYNASADAGHKCVDCATERTLRWHKVQSDGDEEGVEEHKDKTEGTSEDESGKDTESERGNDSENEETGASKPQEAKKETWVSELNIQPSSDHARCATTAGASARQRLGRPRRRSGARSGRSARRRQPARAVLYDLRAV